MNRSASRRGLRFLLIPVTMFYHGLTWWRNFFYDIGFFVTRSVATPVVSVGNITMGGTGKTPATIFLSGLLTNLGYRVGIVSRGYKRQTKGTLLVSDGAKTLVSSADGGDEPVLMAQRLTGVPVLVDEDRYRGAAYLESSHQLDVILLDDGFQHRGLARDFDIVLLDATDTRSAYHIFPYGLMREGQAGLKRADLVIWTRTERAAPSGTLLERITDNGTSQLSSRMEVCPELRELGSDRDVSAGELLGCHIIAFCGIARPSSFYNALMELGLEPETVRYFPDHHEYQLRDIKELESLAAEDDAILVTTAKDAIRLAGTDLAGLKLYILEIKFTLEAEAETTLQQRLLEILPPLSTEMTVGEA